VRWHAKVGMPTRTVRPSTNGCQLKKQLVVCAPDEGEDAAKSEVLLEEGFVPPEEGRRLGKSTDEIPLVVLFLMPTCPFQARTPQKSRHCCWTAFLQVRMRGKSPEIQHPGPAGNICFTSHYLTWRICTRMPAHPWHAVLCQPRTSATS